MATATETLQMILSARDEASGAIRQTGQAARQLGNDARQVPPAMQEAGKSVSGFGRDTQPARQATRLLVSQLGAIGPAGQLASNAIFGFTDGLSKATLASGGAVIGLGLLVAAIRRAQEENAKFDAAIRSGSTSALRSEVEKLEETLAGRRGSSGLAAAFNIVKGAVTGTDEVLIQSRLEEKVGAYKNALEGLNARKVAEITDEFERQAALLDAGPFQKIDIQFDSAVQKMRAAFEQGKIGVDELRASLEGLKGVRESQIAVAERESRSQGRSEEVNLINRLVQMEVQLTSAKKSGSIATQETIQREIAAITSKLSFMDQEVSKRRALQLQTVTDGLANQNIVNAVNQEIARQNQLFEQGAQSAFTLNRNVASLGRLVQTFAAIKGAADAFFKTGLLPAGASVDEMARKVVALEKQSQQTYGVNIPVSVQTAIQKMREFIDKVGQASGAKVDIDALGRSITDSFAGLSGGQGNLDGIGFIRAGTRDVIALTDELTGKLQGLSGTFTNINVPTKLIKDDVASVPGALDSAKSSGDALAGSFGGVAFQASAIASQIERIESTINRINAQGGIKVAQ